MCRVIRLSLGPRGNAFISLTMSDPTESSRLAHTVIAGYYAGNFFNSATQ